MRAEAEANAEIDRKSKEKIDKINHADSLIFQTEKQIKEFGDKLPEDKKALIEQALAKLKEAHKSEDVEQIDKATEELNKVFHAASEDMYKASQPSSENKDAGSPPHQGEPENSGNKKSDSEVTDVDFEEVK